MRNAKWLLISMVFAACAATAGSGEDTESADAGGTDAGDAALADAGSTADASSTDADADSADAAPPAASGTVTDVAPIGTHTMARAAARFEDRIAIVGMALPLSDLADTLGDLSATDGEVFVSVRSTDGGVLWTQRIGACGRDDTSGVAFDHVGNVIVAARVPKFDAAACRLTIGPHVVETPPHNVGEVVSVVAKFSPSGELLWARSLRAYTERLAVGRDGRVYMVFSADRDVVDVGGAIVLALDVPGRALVTLDADGEWLWARRVSGYGGYQINDLREEVVGGIGLVEAPRLVTAGFISSTIDFGGSVGVIAPPPGANVAAVVVTFSGQSGVADAARVFGGTGTTAAVALAPDGAAGRFVAGIYTAAFTVAGTALPPPSDTFAGFVVELDDGVATRAWGIDVPSVGDLAVLPGGDFVVASSGGPYAARVDRLARDDGALRWSFVTSSAELRAIATLVTDEGRLFQVVSLIASVQIPLPDGRVLAGPGTWLLELEP